MILPWVHDVPGAGDHIVSPGLSISGKGGRKGGRDLRAATAFDYILVQGAMSRATRGKVQLRMNARDTVGSAIETEAFRVGECIG